MEYSFGEVERALATLHNIASDKRSAFASRLKHLQKMGFPPGVNTGRGRAATYQPEHVFLLGTILELNQFGFGPEKAVRIVTANMPELAGGAMRALGDGRKVMPVPIICDLPADGLAELTDRAGEVRHMSCRSFDEAVQGIEFIGRAGAGARLAMFSVSGLITVLGALTAFQTPGATDESFSEGLYHWAEATAAQSPASQAEAEFKRSTPTLFERMANAQGSEHAANDTTGSGAKRSGRP